MNDTFTPKRNSFRDRNKKALELFTRNGLNVRLLKFNDQSPVFILDDSCQLSCFINGTQLHFRARPDSAEIIRSVDLTRDTYLNKMELTEILERSEHLPAFRIQHKRTGMFLVGFDYIKTNLIDKELRFPVFAHHKPIVYLNPEKVKTVAEELSVEDYEVEIV